MREKYQFIKNKADLIESISNFMESPEYWREAVGAHPKFFAHFKMENKHFFGLSKFCAFKNIHLQKYIQNLRYKTNGTTTQKHISNSLNKSWIPFKELNSQIQSAFTDWFFDFFPSTYNLDQVYILSVDKTVSHKEVKKKKVISPEEIEKQLKYQNQIGQIGEEIALKYEMDRLKKHNIKKPEKWIDQISKRNISAGFDIWSHPPKQEARFIEVKSSTKDPFNFYITQNEIETSKAHNKNSYLYLVLISDLKRKIGSVIIEIQNPTEKFETDFEINPILFKVKKIKH
jgi:hypothetical protein